MAVTTMASFAKMFVADLAVFDDSAIAGLKSSSEATISGSRRAGDGPV